MNKQAKQIFIGSAIFVVTLVVLFLMSSFTKATFEGKMASDGVSNVTSVLDDTNPVINITVNNTNARGALNNYSIIIIMVDPAINISINGNASVGTSLLNDDNISLTASFSNTSGIFGCAANDGNVYRANGSAVPAGGQARCLNWTGNDTGGFVFLLPGDENKKHVWFNITTYAPAKGLNISIFGWNSTNGSYSALSNGSVMAYNITLNINDTVEVYINGSGIVDGANLSEKAIAGFITVKGNETDMRVTLKAFNSSGDFGDQNTSLIAMNRTWGNQTKPADHGGGNEIIFNGSTDTPVIPFMFNISKIPGGTIASGLPDGLYKINVSVNNSHVVNYGNYSDENVSATLTIRIDNTAPTYTLSDNNDEDTTSQIVVDIAITEAGAGMNASCTADSSLVTISNTNNSQKLKETGLSCGTSKTYAITCTDRVVNTGTATSVTATTDACSGSGSGAAAGGGGGSTTTWTNTYVEDSVPLEDAGSGGVTKDLGSGQRVRLKVVGQEHYVGIKSLTTTSATIEVSSEPQEATLNVGGVKKFDVNNDDYYDMQVTLVSITENKANVKVVAINERVVIEETTPAGEEGAGGQAGEQPTPSQGRSKAVVWIVLILVVIAVVVGFIVYRRKK